MCMVRKRGSRAAALPCMLGSPTAFLPCCLLQPPECLACTMGQLAQQPPRLPAPLPPGANLANAYMMRPFSSAIELTMYQFEENPAHGSFAKQNYKVGRGGAVPHATLHIFFTTNKAGTPTLCASPSQLTHLRLCLSKTHAMPPSLPIPAHRIPAAPAGQGDAPSVVEAADVRPRQLHHVGAREGGARQRYCVQDGLAQVPQHARQVRGAGGRLLVVLWHWQIAAAMAGSGQGMYA